MQHKTVRKMGIAWYHREDFYRLRELFEDGINLPATFEEWLVAAEKFREMQEKSGIRPVLVYIKPADFQNWCADRGLRMNAQARMLFANEGAKAAE